MKRHLRQAMTLVISLTVFAFDRCLPYLGRRPLSARASGVVLVYHAVPDVHVAAFSRQLDTMHRIGHVVGWADVLRPPDGRWAIAITFDDALQSIQLVLDDLMRRQMRATVFVPTAAVGAAPTWPGGDRYGERVLGADQLAALSPELMEVGGHSRHHVNLTGLDGPALTDELAGCFEDLLRITNVKPEALAVPFGFWNERVVEAAMAAGFCRVFSVEPSPVFDPDALVVPRVTVEPTDSSLVFRLKVLGAYRWIGNWMAFKHRLGFHSPQMTRRP